MSTEDLEKRVEEAEREAMEAVDGFLNSGKNPPVPVPASPARMSPNPMACIIVMDSHGNRCPKCPNFAF